MPAPSTDRVLPADLTGQVTYETSQGIHGGHAHVGRGTWTDSKGCVYSIAVKVIIVRPGKVTSVERLVKLYYKRGRRERNIWERLEHANIVPLHGITTDCPFPLAGPNPIAMVSPWMEGGNLFQALEAQPPLGDLTCLHLLSGAAKGLEHLHALDIIQGDLYPANVLIDSQGNARLTDFGLSFIVEDFQNTSYWSRTVGGAMRWRAPELTPPTPEDIEDYVGDLTPKCDIYSFGSLILHAMSGKMPYFNIACDISVILYLHYRIEPTRPPQLADAYWKVITRCWGERHKPASRPSAQELVNDISALQMWCSSRL